jgi:exodeoxyribonuclease-3
MRIATWNVNSLRVRLGHVLDWLATAQPDALALQETKLPDENFPAAAFREAGYEVAFAGQKTYNGVALVSRTPLTEILTELPGYPDPQRRVLAGTLGNVRIFNLYVPNGESTASEKYQYKLRWLAALRAALADELARHPQLIALGDFNIAPADRDVHDPQLWAGKVLCSEPEREALRTLLALGFGDAFRLFDQPDGSFSWWDYRAAAFRRGMGLRIDLILTSPAMSAHCRSCRIDPSPRALERPSDHAPVVAEFDIG